MSSAQLHVEAHTWGEVPGRLCLRRQVWPCRAYSKEVAYDEDDDKDTENLHLWARNLNRSGRAGDQVRVLGGKPEFLKLVFCAKAFSLVADPQL